MAPRRADEYLSISEVVHKTFLALDEKGTEAAAATAVMMVPTAAAVLDPPKPFRGEGFPQKKLRGNIQNLHGGSLFYITTSGFTQPPMLPPDDERLNEVVDITNPANVRYWSQCLLVTDATLRTLVSIHGAKVTDLRMAIDQATKTETSKIFPKERA